MKKKLVLCFIFLCASYWVCDENQRTEYSSHDNHFEEYQQGVLDHSITGPLAYRILMPYTIQAVSMIFPLSSGTEIAFVLNILLMFLAQLAFYRYLRNFLSEVSSFAGTLWLDLVIMMGFASFMGVHVYETTDLCNLLLMSIALHLVYKKDWYWLSLVLFIGMTNRETPAFLLIPVFLCWRKERFASRYLFLCTGAVVIPYLLLRFFIHPPQPAWFLTVFLDENIPFYGPGKLFVVFTGYLKFLLFIAPAALPALMNLKSKNYFLKKVLMIVPVFIPVHILVGHVEEYRMWMPLFFCFIPLCMETFDQKTNRPSA